MYNAEGPPGVFSPNPAPPGVSNGLSGQKRDSYGAFAGEGGQGRRSHDSNVKLFVGSVPRTITEEEVRPLFEEFGNVAEVALIMDRRTGLQQGCCFVKYPTIEEAERAIRGINNQRTLPGSSAPVQVRFADGERERLGAVEHKLFVGSLNKAASEKEIEPIFAKFGPVDDVYIMRDQEKQSRGCAFIKYSSREAAQGAIDGLNGTFTMEGCDHPLAVRFADPKRPRAGETARIGGPGAGYSAPFSPRGTARSTGVPGSSRGPPPGSPGGGWRPVGGPGAGAPPMGMGPRGQYQGPAVSGPRGPSPPVSSQQQPYYAPPYQQQMPPLQAHPGQSSYYQMPPVQQPPPQAQQPAPMYSQAPPPQQQQTPAYYQPPAQHQQYQQPALQPAQQPAPQQPLYLPQAQQAQQLSSLPSQQPMYLASSQQASTYASSSGQLAASASALSPAPTAMAGPPPPPPPMPPAKLSPPPQTCDWTEHTSGEGYIYYYNAKSGESKWEKPPELLAFEQQQQLTQQPLHTPVPPPQQQPQQQPQQFTAQYGGQVAYSSQPMYSSQTTSYSPQASMVASYGQPAQQQQAASQQPATSDAQLQPQIVQGSLSWGP